MKGIYAAAVTPVDEKGRIHMERYGRHARWLLRQGCHGIAVFGTTGETQCYSVGERQDALEAMIGAGLDPSRMILGIGCCARADTVALGRHALEHGVTRLLMLPPFFYKDTADEGMVRAFAEAIEGIGDDRLALYLYHFPRVSMVPVTKGVIARLLDRYPDTVKGLKDSSGDWNHTRDLIETFDGFEVYSGADDHLLDNLQAGGSGTISAAANLACHASRKVFDLWEKGDVDAARDEMKPVARVRTIVGERPLIPAIKEVIASGLDDGEWRRVRPPLMPLSPEEGEALRDELDEAGYVYDPDLYSVAGA